MRRKYWFPGMNKLAETLTSQCFECQTVTRSQRREPVKPTEIPEEPWDTVATDFGLFPDGHYNLVIIDKRTRYPVVEDTTSTYFKQTRSAFKRVFATYGTPRRIESDWGPPFNGREFAEFAKQKGFEHHIVTPDHPRANGEAERFMQVLNKAERIIHNKTKDKEERRTAIQELLTAYRETPHPATGIAPYEGMSNRQIRTKLEAIHCQIPPAEDINKRDQEYKIQMQAATMNKNTKPHNLIKGDCVLVEQKKINKWSLPYEPIFYSVIEVNGSTVTARRISDGRVMRRDGSKFKLANNIMREREELVERYSSEEPGPEDDTNWREQVLMQAVPARPTATPISAKELTPPRISAETEGRPVPAPQTPRARPQRSRKRPAHLKDYVP